MKFPRYTREQKLSSKLSDADVLNIRIERAVYFTTYAALSRKHRVSISTIIACLHPVKRKMDYKRYISPEQNRERTKRYLKRKKMVQPEINEYIASHTKEKMASDPEYHRKRLTDINRSQRKRKLAKSNPRCTGGR